ncbi:hypothetical protein V6N11_031725 [Hibiscus sabdariffa]|uniref:Protein LIKE COV 2-like n=1 Tax=Hibiscus sabdariffa TaxID=183260 RepID=A0ABR2SYI3_9ROSI
MATAMAEEKESTSIPLSQAENGGPDPDDPAKSLPSSQSPNSSTRKACCFVLQSWFSKKFMTGCVVLFPVAVTFFITWWFIQFVDGFFSPLYERLGIDIFGLGFITSLLFVFFVGVFVSSWMGAAVFSVGEWVIKRMPFVRHIYSASKQISAAISPELGFQVFPIFQRNIYNVLISFQSQATSELSGFLETYNDFIPVLLDQNTTAFKEVAIIRHPRVGEYAFGFITSTVTLQRENEDEELCSVFVPTNHLYIGDIFLVNSKEIIRPNLSIREGIEIIVSGGMTMPQRSSEDEIDTSNRERTLIKIFVSNSKDRRSMRIEKRRHRKTKPSSKSSAELQPNLTFEIHKDTLTTRNHTCKKTRQRMKTP